MDQGSHCINSCSSRVTVLSTTVPAGIVSEPLPHTHIYIDQHTNTSSSTSGIPTKWHQSLDLERTAAAVNRGPLRSRLPEPRPLLREVQDPLPRILDDTMRIHPIITLFIPCCCHRPSGFKRNSEVEDSRYVGGCGSGGFHWWSPRSLVVVVVVVVTMLRSPPIPNPPVRTFVLDNVKRKA